MSIADIGPEPNAFDLESDFGIDERDITHRVVFQGTAELGKGFTLSGLGTFRTGLPIPAFESVDVDGSGTIYDRPVDANGNIVPRFPERQPNFYNVDMRLMWTRDLGAAGEIDLLFEIFNVFNNAQFAAPNTVVGSPTFGRITSTVKSSRQIQLAVKYLF